MSAADGRSAPAAAAPVGGKELAELVEEIGIVVFALEETIDVAKALSAKLAALHADVVKASL